MLNYKTTMLIRLSSLIVFSFLISYWLWPLNDVYLYLVVIGVGILIFGLPISQLLSFSFRQSSSEKDDNTKVIQLDEFRRKKSKTGKNTEQKKY